MDDESLGAFRLHRVAGLTQVGDTAKFRCPVTASVWLKSVALLL